ncbi:MAG: hypothetical protein IJL81_01990, partial [Clostridia bacterium]|nr:hypothetical protein [Clostridia bacterium]
IPANTTVPEGYRAIKVQTGLNDNDYIEIKSGLSEQDTVRTLNTESSSFGAQFGGDDDITAQMQQNRNAQMRQMQTGGGVPSGGGMGGSAPGGGNRSGGGSR